MSEESLVSPSLPEPKRRPRWRWLAIGATAFLSLEALLLVLLPQEESGAHLSALLAADVALATVVLAVLAFTLRKA